MLHTQDIIICCWHLVLGMPILGRMVFLVQVSIFPLPIQETHNMVILYCTKDEKNVCCLTCST